MSTVSTESPTAVSSAARAGSPLFNRIIFLLALLGLLVAGLLWNWHAHPIDIPCGGTHDCRDVAQSKYASFPVGSDYPVAMYGFFGYLSIIVLAFLRTMPGSAQRDRRLVSLIALASTLGTIFALQLTYIEAFVLHAWCKWCVASQIIILAIAILSNIEWLRLRNVSPFISTEETVS